VVVLREQELAVLPVEPDRMVEVVVEAQRA